MLTRTNDALDALSLSPQFSEDRLALNFADKFESTLRHVALTQPCGALAARRGLDRGDVNLLHSHHRIKRALCFIAAGRQRLGQHSRRDLPGDAPLVLAPAALALLATIANDRAPVAVGLPLIVGGDLE